MQQAHAYLFASAAFALNKHRHIGLCHPLKLVSDSLHRGSLAENYVQRRQVKSCGGFGVMDQGHFFLSGVGQEPQGLQYASHLHVYRQS
jgi:hypothetical protein